jgi:LPPG:FO 2-phospho-L-lactate transferase
VLEALARGEIVLIGPSNPYVSIDPITARPGVRGALERATVVAVSPLVAGKAVKGPLASMIRELDGVEPSVTAIVTHYQGLLDGIVVERGDEEELSAERLRVHAASTVMRSLDDSARLAREVLAFAESFVR